MPHWVELVTQIGPPKADGFAWLIKHIVPQLLPGTDLSTAGCVGVRRFGMRGSIGAVTVLLGSSSLSQRAYVYAGQVRWLGGSDACPCRVRRKRYVGLAILPDARKIFM